jgi:tetratricopeptide (TPR) repeat protein
MPHIPRLLPRFGWIVCLLLLCAPARGADAEDKLIEAINQLMNKGEYDKAIEGCTFLLKAKPKNPSVVLWLRGTAWLEKKEQAIAIADFTEVIKLVPGFDAAYVERGRAYAELKKPDQAIDDLNQAIRLDPKNARAWLFRGIVWQQKGDKAKAQADFKKAYELDPKLSKKAP